MSKENENKIHTNFCINTIVGTINNNKNILRCLNNESPEERTEHVKNALSYVLESKEVPYDLLRTVVGKVENETCLEFDLSKYKNKVRNF